MTTEELIIHLARSADRVRPLPTPARRLAQWATGAIAATVLGVALIGARPDLWTLARNIPFLALTAATVATALTAAVTVLRVSVPGVERSFERWTPIVVAIIWAGALGVSLVSAGSALMASLRCCMSDVSSRSSRSHCSRDGR